MNTISDSYVPVSPASSQEQQQPIVPIQAKKNDDPKTMFPWLLHKLLEEAELDGLSHVVSWLPGGQRFQVFQRDAFMDNILPKFFRQTKYKSFVRQLNLWGFRCINSGSEKGAYVHEKFVRNEPELCLSMDRIKIKGKRNAAPARKKQTKTAASFPPPPRCVSPRRLADQPTVVLSSNDKPALPSLCDIATSTAPSLALRSQSMDEEGWFSQASLESQRQFHNEHFQGQLPPIPGRTQRPSMTWARSMFENDPVLNQMANGLSDDEEPVVMDSQYRWMDALMVDDIASLAGDDDNNDFNIPMASRACTASTADSRNMSRARSTASPRLSWTFQMMQ